MANEKKRNFSEGWWIRKAVYVVVAVAGLVATGFGIASQEQVDAITASPVLATFVGLVAAFFTNRGSGDSATHEDVEMARASAVVDPGSIAEQVVNRIDTYGRHAADVTSQVQSAASSVADHYRDR